MTITTMFCINSDARRQLDREIKAMRDLQELREHRKLFSQQLPSENLNKFALEAKAGQVQK